MAQRNSSAYPSSYWKYSPFAPEGWWIILLTILGFFATLYFSAWTWLAPSGLLLLFVLQFFRNTFRTSPDVPENHVLSAADGRVIFAGQANDPYSDNRSCIKISVFMNVFNPHANYAPISGKILKKWYYPGKFFNASLDKASEYNERCAVHFVTPQNQVVVCVQIAGLVARRIVCYAEQSDTLNRSDRYGFIRFGSRLDMYLPEDTVLKVKVGDCVKAQLDVLAHLQ